MPRGAVEGDACVFVPSHFFLFARSAAQMSRRTDDFRVNRARIRARPGRLKSFNPEAFPEGFIRKSGTLSERSELPPVCVFLNPSLSADSFLFRFEPELRTNSFLRVTKTCLSFLGSHTYARKIFKTYTIINKSFFWIVAASRVF